MNQKTAVDLDFNFFLFLPLSAKTFSGNETVLGCAFVQVEGYALDFSLYYLFELLCNFLLDLFCKLIFLSLIKLPRMPIELKLHNRFL